MKLVDCFAEAIFWLIGMYAAGLNAMAAPARVKAMKTDADDGISFKPPFLPGPSVRRTAGPATGQKLIPGGSGPG